MDLDQGLTSPKELSDLVATVLQKEGMPQLGKKGGGDIHLPDLLEHL